MGSDVASSILFSLCVSKDLQYPQALNSSFPLPSAIDITLPKLSLDPDLLSLKNDGLDGVPTDLLSCLLPFTFHHLVAEQGGGVDQAPAEVEIN